MCGDAGTWRDRLRAMRRDTFALALACRDRRTPWYAKLTALVVVAYVFSPIDLIPDFIPVLGLLDDLVLVPLGVVLVRRLVPTAVMEDCRTKAEAAFASGRPISQGGAVLVVALWVGLAYLAYRAILPTW